MVKDREKGNPPSEARGLSMSIAKPTMVEIQTVNFRFRFSV